MADDANSITALPRVAEIWRQVLEVEAVNVDDNFFSLGGDSMKATALMVHIEEAFGIILDPVEIFEAPILGEFAETIDRLLAPSQGDLVEEGTL